MSLKRFNESDHDSGPDLIAQLLAEQHRPTAIADFAQRHERGEFDRSRIHRRLLPAEAPRPGEQYAFEVRLDRCSGCKACVTACHSLNGLDDNETWREVGLLIEPPKRPARPWRALPSIPVAQQHVTTACHHCVDPACLNGCPVLAYDKDPLTGIVRHLDDQCIGCQYCVLKCPYDAPKYNSRLGIVRKCDMCSGRLAAGEAPACAQACPTEAIRIVTIASEAVISEFETDDAFLPGAPAGDYTLPATRYVAGAGQSVPAGSTHPAGLVAADAAALVPQPAHWPLVLMLVLTQASVGATIAAAFPQLGNNRVGLLVIAVVLAVLGLASSVFHLGRPLGAWRSFLNLRRSWMSREILAFAVYGALLGLAVIPGSLIGMPWIQGAAAISGGLAVFCSAMIYADTRRELWRAHRSVSLFLLSMLLSGAGIALVFAPAQPAIAALVTAAALAKLTLELALIRHRTSALLTPMKKTALLATGSFPGVAWLRLICLLVGGVGVPTLLASGAIAGASVVAAFATALLLAGEISERWFFFRCVVAPKMPGGLPPC